MCFSTSASFGAGVILSAIGVASIKKVQQPSQLAFAAIPVIFAVQQFSEGFLWLALLDPAWAFLQVSMTGVFLFFAQIVWPVWVPLSILFFEKNQKRKQILRFLTLLGAVVSAYLAYCLLAFHVEAKVLGLHISYEQDYPAQLSRYGGFLYIVATIVPSFFSSAKHMWSLGTAIFVSYIVTELFYEDYIVSVWCFFASIISASVLAVVSAAQKSRIGSTEYSTS